MCSELLSQKYNRCHQNVTHQNMTYLFVAEFPAREPYETFAIQTFKSGSTSKMYVATFRFLARYVNCAKMLCCYKNVS